MAGEPDELTKMYFGKRLKQLRKAKGVSQTGLHRASGVPLATIQNWERSKRMPLLDKALLVAKALNISMGELVGWEPHPEEGRQGPHGQGAGGRPRKPGR